MRKMVSLLSANLYADITATHLKKELADVCEENFLIYISGNRSVNRLISIVMYL